MDNNNGGRKLIVIVGVIILVAVFLAIWFSVRQTGVKTPTTPVALSFSQAQQANASGALDVPDQFPGMVAFISRVDLPAGGFVVIRKGATSTPSDIIGATFFDKDTRIGNVDLSEPTVDGGFYVAQAWTDNGDAQFSTTTDKIITKVDGTVLQTPFKATKDLPEKKG
jgi:hypothetical protein